MTDNDNNTTNELEELVLREALISAVGVNTDTLQIGIKGDPSLRETALNRTRHKSVIDNIYARLQPRLEKLLLKNSVYQLFIGFNNGEIRTRSVFDPLREEIHSAEKLLDDGYISRHFPAIPHREKIEMMRGMYDYIFNSKQFNRVPPHWKKIFEQRHTHWQPMKSDEIQLVLESVGKLRNMEDYYLRNVLISTVQSVVRLQFNCDGTQIVSAKLFGKFMQDNIP